MLRTVHSVSFLKSVWMQVYFWAISCLSFVFFFSFLRFHTLNTIFTIKSEILKLDKLSPEEISPWDGCTQLDNTRAPMPHLSSVRWTGCPSGWFIPISNFALAFTYVFPSLEHEKHPSAVIFTTHIIPQISLSVLPPTLSFFWHLNNPTQLVGECTTVTPCEIHYTLIKSQVFSLSLWVNQPFCP